MSYSSIIVLYCYDINVLPVKSSIGLFTVGIFQSFFISFFNHSHRICQSRGLGRAGPEPSREWGLWLGPAFEKAGAGSGRAKAAAFGPSRAGTSLVTTIH
jgi:hypothetical protein